MAVITSCSLMTTFDACNYNIVSPGADPGGAHTIIVYPHFLISTYNSLYGLLYPGSALSGPRQGQREHHTIISYNTHFTYLINHCYGIHFHAHTQALRWLILVEDSENEHIYHAESWLLTKKMAREGPQTLAFTIPIFEPLPPQVTPCPLFARHVVTFWGPVC